MQDLRKETVDNMIREIEDRKMAFWSIGALQANRFIENDMTTEQIRYYHKIRPKLNKALRDGLVPYSFLETPIFADYFAKLIEQNYEPFASMVKSQFLNKDVRSFLSGWSSAIHSYMLDRGMVRDIERNGEIYECLCGWQDDPLYEYLLHGGQWPQAATMSKP